MSKVKYFPATVHMIQRNFYYTGQEKVSTVQENYEEFKNNTEVMEQVGIPLCADNGMVYHILTGYHQGH